jgi:hypothetical protein
MAMQTAMLALACMHGCAVNPAIVPESRKVTVPRPHPFDQKAADTNGRTRTLRCTVRRMCKCDACAASGPDDASQLCAAAADYPAAGGGAAPLLPARCGPRSTGHMVVRPTGATTGASVSHHKVLCGGL